MRTLRKEQLNILKSYWSTYSYTATAGTSSTALPAGFETATTTKLSGGNHTSTTPIRGIVTSSPGGYVSLRKQASGQTPDDSGTAVFGRLTYSAGTYTVSYKKLSSGSEVSATLSGSGSFVLQMLFPEVMNFGEAPTNSHVASEEFVSTSSGGSVSGSAGGDLSSSFPSPTVVGLTNVASNLIFNQASTVTINPATPNSTGSGRDLIIRAGQRNATGTPGNLHLNSGGVSGTTANVNVGTDGYSIINIGASAGTQPINLYGTVSANNFKITNLATPTAATAEAAPATYVEAVAQIMATDKKFFVSPNGNDSYNGKSWGRPFATLTAAKTALGTSRGVIVLLPGTHNVPAVTDGYAGITLDSWQFMIGEKAATSLNCSAVTGSGKSAIKLSGSRSGLSDVELINVQANTTGVLLGLGATVNPGSNEQARLYNVLVETMGANTIGFGIGSDLTGRNVPPGASDVANAMLVGCRTQGGDYTSYGFVIGNGVLGNVLDNLIIGGWAQQHLYGVWYHGGSAVFRGLSFVQNQGTNGVDGGDIYITGSGSGACSVEGARSEGALRLANITWGTQTANAVFSFRDIAATSMLNTDGHGILYSGSIPFKIDNVRMMGSYAPQCVFSTRTSDTDSTTRERLIMSDGLYSDHPHPFAINLGRAGIRIRSRNTVFLGGAASSIIHHRQTPETWIRRYNVPYTLSSSALTMDPNHFEATFIRLSKSNANPGNYTGTWTIADGTAPGQLFTATVEQDGYGTWTYSWPTNIAWNNQTAPTNYTVARGRQTVKLIWNGFYWEQSGTVINSLPPTPSSNPITETFPVSGNGYKYWLDKPSGSLYSWIHVPGGGALGADASIANKCVCRCLGDIGQINNPAANNPSALIGQGAAAVIETGMATTPTGVSVSINSQWAGLDGLVLHYLDDSWFALVTMSSTTLSVRALLNGLSHPYTSANYTFPTSLVAGTTYTLTVKLTGTGYDISVPGAGAGGGTFTQTFTPAADFVQFSDLTKHGFILGSLTSYATSFSVS